MQAYEGTAKCLRNAVTKQCNALQTVVSVFQFIDNTKINLDCSDVN